jgi:hypothetical protein
LAGNTFLALMDSHSKGYASHRARTADLSATAPGGVQVAPVATGSSWSEASVVASVSTGAATSSVSITQGSTFYTLDVTTAVQDWVDTPANNLGLALTPQTTASITLDSKENTLTSHPAYLEISLATHAASISGSTATTLTGLLKGDGANIAAAIAGTDYLAPTGSGAGLTSLNAGNISTGTLGIANGGTGASTAAGARTNLGLGSLATLSTIGSSEITDGSITGTDVSSIPSTKITGLGTVASLNTTGSTTTFLRGDGTFATPSNSGGTVTSVGTGTGLTGGPITGSGTIALADTAVSPGTYSHPTISIDAQGRIVAAASNSAVSSVSAGTGISITGTSSAPIVNIADGGVGTTQLAASSVTVAKISTTSGTADSTTFLRGDGTWNAPTASLPNTGTAGTYANVRSITTDAQGRVTSATAATGASPKGIPYSISPHSPTSAWFYPGHTGSSTSLNSGTVTVTVPNACTPSMTIWSYIGSIKDWSLFAVTPSTTSVTWTATGSPIITCQTAAASGSSCTATGGSTIAAGTVITLTSGTSNAGAVPGSSSTGGMVAAFSCD